MTHATSSQRAPQTYLALAASAGVPPGFFIFAGTLFTDSTRQSEHEPASYRASVMHGIAFTTSMGWLNDVILPKQRLFIWLSKSWGIALLEASAFYFIFLILLAHTFAK
ncbi:MAG: hypothetical protein ACLPXB_04105 [Thiobacillaceae bacterium]